MSNTTIVSVCDNHYVVLLATLLKSIELNHKGPDYVEVFIVEDKISSRNQKKLIASLDSNKMKINWLSLDDVIPETMKIPFDRSTYPKNIHARMFIPHFIPERFEKIIYLDVDMIVMRDISDLWNIDLGDHVVGATMDSWVKIFGNTGGGILNYKELGFDANTKYFNSGLLVLNTKKWRDEGCAEKVMKCVSDNDKFTNFPDQYGLNVVLSKEWLELDTRWNTFASYECEDPFLIHFIGRKPIYKTYENKENYYKLFYEYLNQTKWKGFKPMGETTRYIKKIKNLLSKIPDFLKR